MKPLKDWSEVEIKAGIYDRQNEIVILQNELRERMNRPSVKKKEEVVEKEEEKKA